MLERKDYLYPDAIDSAESSQFDRSESVVPIRSPLDIDWGEAPDVSVFYGRAAELTKLTTWVEADRCKLFITAVCRNGYYWSHWIIPCYARILAKPWRDCWRSRSIRASRDRTMRGLLN